MLIPIFQTAQAKSEEVRDQLNVQFALYDDATKAEINCARAQAGRDPARQDGRIRQQERRRSRNSKKTSARSKARELTSQLSENPLPASYRVTPELRDWLPRLSGVTVRPVLDPGRTDAVDAHDPPAWMRELVMLRDRHCVFPGCAIDARACDLDHLEPYVPLDQGGPPGQTSPANLACLCRRHHRAKTFAGWRYRRLPDPPDDPTTPVRGTPGPTYEWTSPHLRTYRVTPTPLAEVRHHVG